MFYFNYKNSENLYLGPLPVKVNTILFYKIPLCVGQRKDEFFFIGE